VHITFLIIANFAKVGAGKAIHFVQASIKLRLLLYSASFHILKVQNASAKSMYYVMEFTTYSFVIFTSTNYNWFYIVYSLMLDTTMNMQVTVSRINYTFCSMSRHRRMLVLIPSWFKMSKYGIFTNSNTFQGKKGLCFYQRRSAFS
jgi:hypothetical protein